MGSIHYNIIYPHCAYRNISATIKLNGKLLFWATLQTNDFLRNYNGKPLNKSTVWNKAKQLSKSPNRFNSYTLAFLALNKAYGVNYLMKDKIHSRNVYYCFNLLSNDYFNFILKMTPPTVNMLNEKSKINPVYGSNNFNYIAHYDSSIRTITLIDPPTAKIEKDLNRQAFVLEHIGKLIYLVKELGAEEYECGGHTYIITRNGSDFFGIDKCLISNSPDFNCLNYDEETDEILIKSGIIVGGFMRDE